MSSRVAAVVPAAGLGRRFGGKTRKLFTSLNNRPLLSYTLKALQRSRHICWIQVVARPGELAQAQRLISRFRITKALPPCSGGRSRSESVAKGVAALPKQTKWILVHDGARPCVSVRLIDAAVRAARRYHAVATGLPAFLTVKDVRPDNTVRATLDRRRLWFVQTPQVFRRGLFEKAVQKAGRSFNRFSDDAAVVEAAGFSVRMVEGDSFNIKITTQEDLILAEAIIRRRCG